MHSLNPLHMIYLSISLDWPPHPHLISACVEGNMHASLLRRSESSILALMIIFQVKIIVAIYIYKAAFRVSVCLSFCLSVETLGAKQATRSRLRRGRTSTKKLTRPRLRPKILILNMRGVLNISFTYGMVIISVFSGHN
jgi:hypothetical protein